MIPELDALDGKIRPSKSRLEDRHKKTRSWKDLFVLMPDERGTVRAHLTGKLARRWRELKIGLESKHELRDTVEALRAICEHSVIGEPIHADDWAIQQALASIAKLLEVMTLPLPLQYPVPTYFNEETGVEELAEMPPTASRAKKRTAAKRVKKILCDAIDVMIEGKSGHKNRAEMSGLRREELMIEAARQLVEKSGRLPTKKELKDKLICHSEAGRLFPSSTSTQWARLFADSCLSKLPKG